MIEYYLLKNKIRTEIHYLIAPYRQKALLNPISKEDHPLSGEILKTTLSISISYFVKVCATMNGL